MLGVDEEEAYEDEDEGKHERKSAKKSFEVEIEGGNRSTFVGERKDAYGGYNEAGY